MNRKYITKLSILLLLPSTALLCMDKMSQQIIARQQEINNIMNSKQGNPLLKILEAQFEESKKIHNFLIQFSVGSKLSVLDLLKMPTDKREKVTKIIDDLNEYKSWQKQISLADAISVAYYKKQELELVHEISLFEGFMACMKENKLC